jgi:acyl carrier protein
MTTLATETFDAVLRRHLKYLSADDALEPDADLRSLGLDSMAAVDLLFDIEDSFDLVLPDEALVEQTFATPATLRAVLDGLDGGHS